MTAPSPAATAPASPRARISLQVKLVVGLLVIVMTPLLVSAYFFDQLGKVAANFAANDAARREASMQRAKDVYVDLFDTTKRLHAEVARRLAAQPALARLAPDAPLDRFLAEEHGLVRIALVDVAGATVAEASRPLPETWGPWDATDLDVIEHLPGGGKLALTFAVPDLQPHYRELQASFEIVRNVQRVRSALPRAYLMGLLAVIAAAGVVAIIIGVVASRVITRRIGVLVGAARKVSAGDAAARAELRGRDEMAELAVAFNTMLDDLDRQRGEIQYLQRIGAWQDVARSLAHEIKNPLTPIQLAVQQCVSSYKGDDPRFKRLLADTGEIVEEEIAGLRRLVDTFRTLGQLPRVEATPLPLREVIDDLRLDGTLAARLEVVTPAGADADVTVRADKLLLKRLLTNLCENGVHAGQEAGRDGRVVVGWGAAADPRHVAITVDDQGKGVAAADRARIFEPYVTTKQTGTGLGLAIAKKIALEHGGALDVADAPAPTGGARFIVTLPLGS